MRIGYPKQYATKHVIVKVYMAIATNASLQTAGGAMDYWNMAYEEGMKAYGQYALLMICSLFTVEGENSSESILSYKSLQMQLIKWVEILRLGNTRQECILDGLELLHFSMIIIF